MPGEAERPVEEPADGDVVRGDQRRRRPRAEPARLAGDPQRREARLVGGAEVEPAGRDEVGRGGRRRAAVGVGQGVLDGKSHVGGAQLGLQGAVHEADGRVDDALRVDDDLDRVVADIVQPVCLDDLQALVGERRRVDGDLGAHRPGRVAERLLRGDRRQRPPASRRGTARRTRSGSGPRRRPSIRRRGTARSPSAPSRSGGARPAGSRTGRPGASAATPAASARASGMTRWPPATSVSLLAVATTLPARERGEDRPEADDPARRRRRRGRRRRGSRASIERVRAADPFACRAAGPGRRAPAASARATAAGRNRRGLLGQQAPRSSRRRGATTRNAPGWAARTSIVWRPIEPVEPRRATRAGARSPAPPGSADEGDDIQRHDRGGEHERIDPVEHAAVARDQRPGILGAGGPLDDRLGEVAGLRGERGQRAEDERVRAGSGRGPTGAAPTTIVAATTPPIEALDGLGRRDVGQELASARSSCRRGRRPCRTTRPRGPAAGSSRARAPSALQRSAGRARPAPPGRAG